MVPRHDHGDPPGQSRDAAASARNTGLDRLGRGARRDERQDGRPGARQAGAQRPGLARRPREPRQLRVGRRPVRLVEPVDRQVGEQLEAARRDARDADGDAARGSSTACRSGTWSGSTPRMSSVASRRSGMYSTHRRPARGVEPDRARRGRRAARRHEPAEQRGGGVVRVALDASAASWSRARVGSSAPPSSAFAAGDPPPTVAAADEPEPARERDGVVHPDPPADARGPRADGRARAPASRPRDEPVVAVVGELDRALAARPQLDLRRRRPPRTSTVDAVDQVERQPEAVEARRRGWPTSAGTSTATADRRGRPGVGAPRAAPAHHQPSARLDVASVWRPPRRPDRDPAFGGVGSLRPLPVSTHTTVASGSSSPARPRLRDARQRGRRRRLAEHALEPREVPVARRGSPRRSRRRCGRRTRRAPRSPCPTTPGCRSGSPSRRSRAARPGWPRTSGAAPAAWKPHIRGRRRRRARPRAYSRKPRQ